MCLFVCVLACVHVHMQMWACSIYTDSDVMFSCVSVTVGSRISLNLKLTRGGKVIFCKKNCIGIDFYL